MQPGVPGTALAGVDCSPPGTIPEVPWCPQVRLLTGIGRYNEMTYIFELLHHKHYFEVLMRKNLDPVREGQTCSRNWCL